MGGADRTRALSQVFFFCVADCKRSARKSATAAAWAVLGKNVSLAHIV